MATAGPSAPAPAPADTPDPDLADASRRRVVVALDGRGAERGPEAVIAAIRSLQADPNATDLHLRVFGDPDALATIAGLDRVELIASHEEIGNHEEPVAAVRSRPGASIVMAAADAAAAGPSDALVSPGSTGATMTAALFAMRRLYGVRRPALALELPIPGQDGPPAVLLDVGANAEARAVDLVGNALLGSMFSRAVLGAPSPRVALLSVGAEAKKGTPEIVEAHAELASLAEHGAIEFVGNVEGNELLSGRADVIVTDGFTGNVVLKTLEGTARAVAEAVGDAARSNPMASLGGLMLRPALGGLRRRMDPDMTGGAILLGLRGVAIVGHGSAGPEGIANAVRLARRAVTERAVERTAELLDAWTAERA